MISVLLVDDHQVVRSGYKRMFERTKQFEVITVASTGQEAITHYQIYSPDVVIMDLSLPDMSGIDALKEILEMDSKAKILVISLHESASLAERSLRAGAKGYVTKSSDSNVILDSLRAIASGKSYISHDIAEKITINKIYAKENERLSLSRREFEIFMLVAEGNNVSEIAQKLSLQSKTVSNHITKIKNNLRLANSAEFVHLALAKGLIDITQYDRTNF